MDKSFYCIDEQEQHSTIVSSIQRNKIIRSICEGKNLGYVTEYKYVVKLCRVCINDVIKELINFANTLTKDYKVYNKKLKTLLEEREAQLNDSNRLKEINESQYAELTKELKTQMTKNLSDYEKYVSLIDKFKKVKLYTKCCYVCKALSEKTSRKLR